MSKAYLTTGAVMFVLGGLGLLIFPRAFDAVFCLSFIASIGAGFLAYQLDKKQKGL